jgi:hypothetical protein
LTVFGGGEEVTSRAEVLRDRTIGGKEALCASWRLKPLHSPFSLARRLVGVFAAIVQIPMLPMFPTGQPLALGGAVALERIRDDHPGHVLAPFKELTEEFLRGLLATPTLDQDVQHISVLIHSTSEIKAAPMDECFFRQRC